MNDLAVQIKERLTIREVIEFYGFHPDRAGYIQCPFHSEKTASMKVYDGDKGFHCFGCGAHGSVIDFVMQLFGISFRQACVRLNADFGLNLVPGRQPSRTERSAAGLQRRREAERRTALDHEYRVRAEEHRYWWEVKKQFAPDDGRPVLHPLYAEALRRLTPLEYWLEEHISD